MNILVSDVKFAKSCLRCDIYQIWVLIDIELTQ